MVTVFTPTKGTVYASMAKAAKKAKIGDIFDTGWRGIKYKRVDARKNNGEPWKQI